MAAFLSLYLPAPHELKHSGTRVIMAVFDADKQIDSRLLSQRAMNFHGKRRQSEPQQWEEKSGVRLLESLFKILLSERSVNSSYNFVESLRCNSTLGAIG